MKRTVILLLSMAALVSCGTTNNSSVRDGNQFVPYEQRNGEEAVVYFTRNLSAEGLMAAYEKVACEIGGNVGGKVITAADAAKGLKPFVKE